MSNKISLDKYYTPVDLAKRLINTTYEVIGKENITRIIEPSAGNGSFSLQLPNCLAYDIEPEHESIIQADFLALDIPYERGTLVIGNPPFGSKMNLAVQFYNKSVEIADYIAFILPISQLNNTIKLYKFDLIYSENLGKIRFSDREVHCCFNIYKRPPSGKLNSKPNFKLKDVEIRESRKNKNPKRNRIVDKKDFDYDIRICAWGAAIGKEVEFDNQYAKEFCIKVNNEQLKEKVLDLIRNTKWEEVYHMTTTPNLLQWQVYKYLKEQIPELK